jgi:hypothetical protein
MSKTQKEIMLQVSLMIAILKDDQEAISNLIRDGAKVDFDALHMLFDLSFLDGSEIDLEMLGFLLHNTIIDISQSGDYPTTLLHKAEMLGNQEAILLISHKMAEQSLFKIIGDSGSFGE